MKQKKKLSAQIINEESGWVVISCAIAIFLLQLVLLLHASFLCFLLCPSVASNKISPSSVIFQYINTTAAVNSALEHLMMDWTKKKDKDTVTYVAFGVSKVLDGYMGYTMGGLFFLANKT